MLLQNNTDRNISIFQGIFVPARGVISVQPDALAAVEQSPLIADYIKAGDLTIVVGEAAPVIAEKIVTEKPIEKK